MKFIFRNELQILGNLFPFFDLFCTCFLIQIKFYLAVHILFCYHFICMFEINHLVFYFIILSLRSVKGSFAKSFQIEHFNYLSFSYFIRIDYYFSLKTYFFSIDLKS